MPSERPGPFARAGRQTPGVDRTTVDGGGLGVPGRRGCGAGLRSVAGIPMPVSDVRIGALLGGDSGAPWVPWSLVVGSSCSGGDGLSSFELDCERSRGSAGRRSPRRFCPSGDGPFGPGRRRSQRQDPPLTMWSDPMVGWPALHEARPVLWWGRHHIWTTCRVARPISHRYLVPRGQVSIIRSLRFD
jgi:hypothetical protein